MRNYRDLNLGYSLPSFDQTPINARPKWDHDPEIQRVELVGTLQIGYLKQWPRLEVKETFMPMIFIFIFYFTLSFQLRMPTIRLNGWATHPNLP